MREVLTPTTVLAVDLGGTKVEAALVSPEGTVLEGSRARATTGATKTAEELAAAVTEVVTAALAAAPQHGTVIGAGIGCAGPVHQENGTVSPLNLTAWRNYPLRDLVAAISGLPTTLRIDGLCITLAEHWVGAGQGIDNLMGMVVSTGVGGGLIVGGHAVAGPSGNAGHIGHIQVGGATELCPCGGIGCVEAVASGPRTVAWAREHGFTGLTGEDLAAAHAAGDPIAHRAVARAGHAVGSAIASATALLDLERVAIGGGFAGVSPALFDHIRQAIAERHGFDFVTSVEVVPSGLSGVGPLVGAAALIYRADRL